MSKGKDRTAAVLIIIGAIMIAASAGLVLWNYYESSKAQKAASEQLVKVEKEISRREQVNTDSSIQAAFIPQGSEIKKMPVAEIDGNDYIGYLSIPSVDLKTPVMNTYNDYKLNIAPCRYYGSLETDNLVIAGHNFYGGFNKLTSLKESDKVIFTNMDGDVFTYHVGEIEMLDPDQVVDMVESSWDLTLYTCNYTASQRFTVRCKLIESN